MPYLVHEIFQRHHIPPDEFYAKPYEARLVMLASMLVRLEDEGNGGDR